MGYRRTHFSALLISTLSSLLSQLRRGKPNCKLAESDLEKDTGWPIEPICSEVSLFQLDLDGRWGQTEHSCRLILRDCTGLFLHCIFSRLYLTTTPPQKKWVLQTFYLPSTVNSWGSLSKSETGGSPWGRGAKGDDERRANDLPLSDTRLRVCGYILHGTAIFHFCPFLLFLPLPGGGGCPPVT